MAVVTAPLDGGPFPATPPTPELPSELAVLGSTAALILAAVFAVAAVAKLRRPSADELGELGLPLAGPLSALLPPSELIVAILLVLRPRWGGVAAGAMLVVFTAVLVTAVLNGRDVSCGCFGARSSSPVGWSTIGRNGVLLVLAAVATATPALVVPDLASVLVLTGVAVVGAVTAQLAELGRTVGRPWSVELAGESRPNEEELR